MAAAVKPAGGSYRIVGVARGVTSGTGTAAVSGDPIACTLSPDGKWFAYGDGTGFSNSSTRYRRRMP